MACLCDDIVILLCGIFVWRCLFLWKVLLWVTLVFGFKLLLL